MVSNSNLILSVAYIMYQNCDNVNSIINKNCGFYLILTEFIYCFDIVT
jgi:hypothetical protein